MTSAIQIDTIQSATSGQRIVLQGAPTGMVLATTVIRNGTRTATSSAYNYTLFSGGFTKTTSTSNLVVTCTVWGVQYNDGNAGTGFVLDGTTWDWGTAYNYDGAWTNAYETIQVIGTGYFTGVSAGVHTMGWGWKAVSGGASRAFNYFNPNATDQSRNGQFYSQLIVYEIAG
jgi:hypothetical protein